MIITLSFDEKDVRFTDCHLLHLAILHLVNVANFGFCVRPAKLLRQ